MFRRGRQILLAFCVVCAAVSPRAANGQVLQGRVIDRSTSVPLAGVAVELSGSVRLLTNIDGYFRFTGIQYGRYTLRVHALGYLTEESVVEFKADTTFMVRLAAAPLRMDSLVVAARTVTIRGELKDAETGAEVIGAEILVGLSSVGVTNAAGVFTARGVAASVPHRVQVRAFGYLPAVMTVDAAADTMLSLRLAPDPAIVRLVAQQVERIERRSLNSPLLRQVFSRTHLVDKRQTSVGDILRARMGARRVAQVRCVIIDEVESPLGMEALKAYLPDQLERIEALRERSDALMIRVYTRSFMARMVQQTVSLPSLSMAHCNRVR